MDKDIMCTVLSIFRMSFKLRWDILCCGQSIVGVLGRNTLICKGTSRRFFQIDAAGYVTIYTRVLYSLCAEFVVLLLVSHKNLQGTLYENGYRRWVDSYRRLDPFKCWFHCA